MIDWNKPIETFRGGSAKVHEVLINGSAIVSWTSDVGVTLAGVQPPDANFLRNTPAAPTWKPFTFETFPRGVVYIRVRGAGDEIYIVNVIGQKHVWRSGIMGDRYETLLSDYEISTDLGVTWGPCGERVQG